MRRRDSLLSLFDNQTTNSQDGGVGVLGAIVGFTLVTFQHRVKRISELDYLDFPITIVPVQCRNAVGCKLT